MRVAGAAALLVAAALAGCATATKAELSNDKDHFSFDVDGTGRSAEESWDWRSEGGDVRIHASIGEGSAELAVKDDAGRLVFHETLSADGTQARETTLQGTAGGWWKIGLRTLDASDLSVRLDTVSG